MKLNPALNTDFYKTGHIKMYPEGTQQVYSNMTPRSDRHFTDDPDFDHKIVNFGLQGVLQWMYIDIWNKHFFDQPRDRVIKEFKEEMDTALGPGVVDVEPMASLHELGYLPIRIKALPEGERVPVRVPLFTITNTHPDFYWVTNYLESDLSANFWKSVTNATRAFTFRQLLEDFAEETGTPRGFVNWQAHDFSYRGLSTTYDSILSGAAHLTSFMGTDTIPAIKYLRDYYGATGLVGGSVPATEHSVMCMGGEDDEIKTFERLMKLYPNGILSVVSDTWDLWAVVTQFLPRLKDQIMERNGKLVIRPDSGDPVKIICGDPAARRELPAHKGLIELLWDEFGGSSDVLTRYRTLDSHIGSIYGDSINYKRAKDILSGLANKGFSSGNVVFGVGSYTYQMVTRDTLGTAFKATYGVVNGEPRVLFKAPKTDDGIKNSARGLLRVDKVNGEYVLRELCTPEEEAGGELQIVFEDSKMIRMQTLDDIQTRLHGCTLASLL